MGSSYPEAWRPLPPPQTRDCADFVGSYSDYGPRAVDYDLAGLLNLDAGTTPGSLHTDATRISLSAPSDGIVEVTSWREKKRLDSRTLNCEGGRLVARAEGKLVAGTAVAARQTPTVTLFVDGDYLVVRDQLEDLGVVFVVPVWAKETKGWYRFPRVRE